MLKTTVFLLILHIIGLQKNVDGVAFAKRVATSKIECSMELGLKAEFILSITEQQFFTEFNQHFNTFYACFMKKMGLQDDNGNINYTNMANVLEQVLVDRFEDDPHAESKARTEAIRIVDKCRNVRRGNSHGQYAVIFRNCLMSSNLLSYSL